MTRPPPRDNTPVTGEEWRRLGFYHEFDPDRRLWRLCGSRSGLLGFARLVERYAGSTAESSEARPLQLGPFGDLQVKLWERPGIDDESLHGRPEDLRRLVKLIESRLADAWPGAQEVIGPEYAADVECSLLFEVLGADFDPAAAVPAAPVEDLVTAPTLASPQIAFTFHDPDGKEWEGMVHLEGTEIVIQHKKKETVLDRIGEYFGGERPVVQHKIIQLSEVTLARFKRGVFGANLKLQVSDISLVEDVPRIKAGTIRLDFRRADRDAAALLAAAIDELLEEA